METFGSTLEYYPNLIHKGWWLGRDPGGCTSRLNKVRVGTPKHIKGVLG